MQDSHAPKLVFHLLDGWQTGVVRPAPPLGGDPPPMTLPAIRAPKRSHPVAGSVEVSLKSVICERSPAPLGFGGLVDLLTPKRTSEGLAHGFAATPRRRLRRLRAASTFDRSRPEWGVPVVSAVSVGTVPA